MNHLEPKMVHPHNSGSAVRIVLHFFTMKGTKRVKEIILIVFSKKKYYLGQFGHFGPKMACPQNFGSVLRVFLWNKMGQEVHKHFISCFLGKNLICSNQIYLGHFLLFDWAWSKLSQATFTFGSLNSQGMISQVNVYMMNIVWTFSDVYVWKSIFNRGSYGFVKELL